MEQGLSLPLHCDQEVIYRLRSLQFELATVAELDLMSPAGYLVCSSWQKIDPPIQIDMPLRSEQLEIRGPVLVEFMQKPALVLARRRPDGGQINALVPQSWLSRQSLNYNIDGGFSAIVDSDSSVPMAVAGSFSLPLAEQSLLLNRSSSYEGTFDDDERKYMVIRPLRSAAGVSVIAAIDLDELYRGTLVPDVTLTIAYVIWFVLVFVLLYRWNRRTADPVHQLRGAIERGEFFNVYQPLVDTFSGRTDGVEVLVRRCHPTEGVQGPSTFIPIAEESGLITEMTRQQLQQLAGELPAALLRDPGFKVSINISAVHLADPSFVRELIHQARHMPGMVLEITENQILEVTSEHIQQSLKQLKQAGIRIAIDDFGTGYCGLAYLESLPLYILKVDRCFVAAIGTDSVNADVLETILTLASKLGVEVIAEGVETAQQSRHLRDLGVNWQQGWYFGKAQPADQLAGTGGRNRADRNCQASAGSAAQSAFPAQ